MGIDPTKLLLWNAARESWFHIDIPDGIVPVKRLKFSPNASRFERSTKFSGRDPVSMFLLSFVKDPIRDGILPVNLFLARPSMVRLVDFGRNRT